MPPRSLPLPPRVSVPLLCLLLPTPQVVASGNPNGPNGGPCGPGAADAAAVTRNEFVSVGGGLGAADSASWGGTLTTFGVVVAAEGKFDVCYDFAGRGRWSAVVGTLTVLDGATAAGQAQAAAVSATAAAAASAPSILSLSPATVVQGVETVVVVHGRMLRDADDAVLVRGSACPSDASDSLAVSEGVGGHRTRLRSGTAAASALLDAVAFSVKLNVAGEYALCYRFGAAKADGSGFGTRAGGLVVTDSTVYDGLMAQTWTGELRTQHVWT